MTVYDSNMIPSPPGLVAIRYDEGMGHTFGTVVGFIKAWDDDDDCAKFMSAEPVVIVDGECEATLYTARDDDFGTFKGVFQLPFDENRRDAIRKTLQASKP